MLLEIIILGEIKGGDGVWESMVKYKHMHMKISI